MFAFVVRMRLRFSRMRCCSSYVSYFCLYVLFVFQIFAKEKIADSSIVRALNAEAIIFALFFVFCLVLFCVVFSLGVTKVKD